MLRQQHQNTQALTAFAQASDAAGEDQTTQESLLQTGGSEGLRINPKLSLLSDFSVNPIFEDTTVYVLDSKLDGVNPVPISDTALLPPPRSSLQTQGTVAYHLHLNHLPTASGFFQVQECSRADIGTKHEFDRQSEHDGLFPQLWAESDGSPGDQRGDLRQWHSGNDSPRLSVARVTEPESVSRVYLHVDQFLFQCGFGQRVFHTGIRSLYRHQSAFAVAGRWRRLPRRRAVGQNGAGDGMGSERSAVPAEEYRELLHLLLRRPGTQVFGSMECTGDRGRSAHLAHCGYALSALRRRCARQAR